MGKTIRFNENGLIAIKNRLNEITAGNDEVVSLNEARPECDVFYLGMEPGGGPGLYCHAKEKKKKKKKKKHKMNESKEVLQELKITNNAKFKKEHNHIFVIYRGNMLLSTYGGKREIFNFLVKSGFKADKLEQLAGNWWYNYGSDLHYLVNDIPYLIAGYIRKEAVYNRYLIQVIPNEGYDVLNSNEFYQFVRALPSLIGPINYKKCAIKVGNQEVDKNEIINNRGQQLPSTWYHGTRNIDALGAILGVGIRPTPEKSVYNVKHNDTVFVTSDLSLGEKYAKFKSNETYGTFPSPDYIAPCVLVVDGTKLDVNRVVFDFDVYGKYKNTRDDEIYNGIIDKTSAALGNANAFEKKGNFIDDTKNPMRFSKIGYRGVIHNNAIIGVIVDGKELSKEQFVELMKGKNVTLNPVKEDRQKANRLLEHHLDQRLPFDEPEYANKYYAEQYRDWLEEYGKYGTLPPSKLDFWEEVKKAITYIKENSIKGDRDVSLPKDLSEEEIFKRLKEGRIGPYLRVTNDGKIYVERAVKIDEDPTQFSENGKEELYDRLMRDYGNNVGGCWSYCLYGSRAYCGGRYRNRIVLRGYIRTDDIDYVNTILTNYNYDNQYEIRVKPFAQVQLFNFTYGKYTIRFRNNLIVSSTYFGNNSRFTGNACKIDDGFGNFTYVDRKNNILTKEEYNDELNRYTDECLASGKNLKGVFDDYYLNKTGFALIEFSGKINYINPNGKRVSDIWFDGGSEFSENRARVKLNGKEAYIDENGRRISDWYDDCGSFYEGFAEVRMNNKYNYINKEGKRINNDWYDYCNYFKDGFAVVRLNSKSTIINENGDRICDWYDNCGDFYFGGFAEVKLGDKSNYVDTQGKRIFKNWYDNCLPFENGYAPVKIDGKWTYVDQNESVMFEPRYDRLSFFTDGFGLAELRYRQAFIDINGDPISDWYDYIGPIENGFAKARIKGQWTFINSNGERINDIWYRDAEDFKEDGTARVRVAKKWSYIDQNGKQIQKEKNEAKNNKKIIIPESKLDVIKESNIPQEFIDRAKEFRPDKFSNWAVINLIDINQMPQYFEKRSKALEYYKWMKMEPKNKAVIVNLDESIDFNKNGLSINDDKILDKYNLKDLILSKNGNYVTLNKIVANEFGKGNGSRFMEELTKIADENGWVLTLTPDTSFGGTSVGRLKNFYKRFGFKPNKGRNTDFNTRESMVRKPEKNKNVIIPENRLGIIKENIESEVESSEVDLSSFRKRDTLPPKIWKDGDTLDSRVRLKLLDIADDFWEFVNLTWVEPKGIIMTGSMCNFNWSEFSDIDLHLIVDFNEVDEKKEFVKQYLDSKKDEWNDRHEDLKIMGFPVELYVQDVDDSLEAGGIYDLEENAWTRKPNSGSIKSIGLDKFSIKDKAAEIMTIIDDMYNMLSNTDDSHKIEEIGDDAHYLWDKVKDLRKKSLDKHGESGPGNIVYKVLRRTGYLDKLFKLFSKVYDRSNSISENVKKYLAVLKEEVAMDGSSEGNPYAERWKEERDALKNFIANYGKLMQSKEDNKMGKLYKVYYDKTMSELIGYNYCICVQWDEIEMKPGSTVYIRALDKFTPFIRRNLQFDDRGRDNVRGNYDDMRY